KGPLQRGTTTTIECPSLPQNGHVGWWYEAVGTHQSVAKRGEGIKIGVLGTGVGPHPCLAHVRLLDGSTDVGDHETYVCGLIGAKPTNDHQFAGIAPEATILSLRIFDEDLNANQSTIALAIDFLSDPHHQNSPQVDLINMSFGGAESP